jgi:DNA ligase (NAD+)
MANESFSYKTYLANMIRINAQLYYEGHPVISDEDFDILTEKFHSLYPEDYSKINKTGWGYDPEADKESNLRKIPHIYQEVGSISRKPRTVSDIPEDFFGIKSRSSIKLDGLSGVAYIRKGKLYLGLTRGNGLVGIDITDKLLSIMSRFKSEINSEFTGAVRGELVISEANWKKMQYFGIAGEDSRNVATGIIRRNELSTDLQYIDFVVYKVLAVESPAPSKYDWTDLESVEKFLRDNFQNVSDSIYFDTISGLKQEDYERMHDVFAKKYPADGDVLTKCSLNRDPDSGSIEYDEVAYKFNGEKAISTVTEVEWNLSRTRRLVPIIHIDPVRLSGATISKVTGINAKFILENKIKKGTSVSIIRSGEVIPKIMSVLVDGRWADMCTE